MKSIKAVKPVAPYIGGKRRLAARLIEIQSEIPHAAYVEPFVGMGGVFFRRPWVSQSEIINDFSRDVSGLFRVLQRHYVPLMDMLRWQLTSRDEFERLKSAVPDSLTDLERAARFLYLQRTAFGGKVCGQNFAMAMRSARFDIHALTETLQDVHRRLSRVTIECLPFSDVLKRYDRPDTLFYLDPPYWGSEGEYGAPFSREDFHVLLAALERLQGRFVLSINDRPQVREIFGGFNLEEVSVPYTVGGGQKNRRFGELIITN
ncbi:DNA adenine methylase [Acetobacter cibinongensis]|uniref:site-specific DNA-methyltransferase (adenine-specific) n=1 Tax=Acetobacter cibinongensis TaxID=146475 RepID=A0A1Z5YR87_9PROT|nr:DNA adenine methylase [Acetobacter cibinongensis]OUI98339.1 DNA methyltransferase [Acetobacter cibinongensis]